MHAPTAPPWIGGMAKGEWKWLGKESERKGMQEKKRKEREKRGEQNSGGGGRFA